MCLRWARYPDAAPPSCRSVAAQGSDRPPYCPAVAGPWQKKVAVASENKYLVVNLYGSNAVDLIGTFSSAKMKGQIQC